MKDEQISLRLRRGGRVDRLMSIFIVIGVVFAMAIASALVSVQPTSAQAPCGNGVVDPTEDCDPSSPTGALCLPGELCVNCQCTTCGNGLLDPGEDCDPSSPSGALVCPMGTVCTGTCDCVSVSSTSTSTVGAPTTVPTTTATTTTSPTTTSTEINHFQCYEVRRVAVPTHVVTVQDQFHSAANVTLSKPNRLCAPTNKQNEDPGAQNDPGHLKAWQDKHTGPKVVNQVITNQFGSLTLDVSRPSFLLVPASKSLVGNPPPLTPPTPDHFQCHKVKRSRGAAKFVKIPGVTGQDQFGPYSVDLMRPRWLCAPANKNGEDPTAPTHPGHLLCYKTRNNTPFAERTATVNDQFGLQNVLLHRRIELCVPSLKNAGATTTTTTVVQTTTTSSTVTTSSTTSSTSSSTNTTSSTTSSTSSSTNTTSSTSTSSSTSSSTSTTLYGSPSRAFVNAVPSLLD
jgi:hypothetical protein